MVAVVVGIDPGQSGALAFLSETVTLAVPMPDDPNALVRELAAYADGSAHVFLEKAQAMPGQGVSSMFNYGNGYGFIRGVLSALKIPHTLVSPRTWCSVMHRGASEGLAKRRSLEVARRLFPSFDLRGSDRATKPHAGIVDALLIAEYGRRVLGGLDVKDDEGA